MPHQPRLRLVLDTNTVMALWFFDDPALTPLRQAINDRRFGLVTRADALDELRRVLAYRQFGASGERQAAILTNYAARIQRHVPPEQPALPLPDCRDRDDQKFLEIARDAGATHLISRDKALLRLNRHRLIRPLFAILTPEAFQRLLDEERGEAAA